MYLGWAAMFAAQPQRKSNPKDKTTYGKMIFLDMGHLLFISSYLITPSEYLFSGHAS
jgi:hypothetical protein